MKVECRHCSASGQMDETKIPPGVTSITCPRCKESLPISEILVSAGSQAPDEAAQPDADTSQSPIQPLHSPQAANPTPINNRPNPAAFAPKTATAATANCTVCSGQFPRDEMVRFGTAWVCAACKPDYVQMLAQGTPRPGEMSYAGFGIRLGAKMLDGLILGAGNILLTLLVGFALPKATPQTALAFSAVMIILQFSIAAAYSGFFLGKYRATPGKMACGIVVVSPEGQPISFWRGVGRYFGEMLSSLTLSIGYLMVAFDDEKRALHDRVCNTRVVYK